MGKGWIAIHRSLQDNWIWKSKEPFDRRSAWIDLLLLATHTDNKELYRGELVSRKRGEINCSILWLSKRWRWSRGKTERFLNVLETDKMLTQKRTANGTTITIENYNKYQNVRATNSTTDSTTHRATDGQPTGTPNNVITIKNNDYYFRPPEKDEFIKSGIMALSDDELKILRGEA